MKQCKSTRLGYVGNLIQVGDLVEPVKCMGIFGEVKVIAKWSGSTWLFIERSGWFPSFKYRKIA